MGAGHRPPEGVTAASTRRVNDGTAPQLSAASLIRLETRSLEEVLVARKLAAPGGGLFTTSGSGGVGGTANATRGGGGSSVAGWGGGGAMSDRPGWGSGMGSAHGSFYSEDANFDARSIPSVPGSGSRRRTYGGEEEFGRRHPPTYSPFLPSFVC